jgi:sulfur carrier protein
VNVVLNGEPTTVDDCITVDRLAASVLDRPKGVAVAVNGEVVPRSAWDRTELREDDQVEVVTAKAGG